MDSDNDWPALLSNHPIFSLPKSWVDSTAGAQSSLELSSNTLPDFTSINEENPMPSGGRQVMLLKGADLILAAGKEIRMTSRVGQSSRKIYKTLHTPNVQFDIHHIALNPSGKLLAVAGGYQVAVIVLPRSTFTRLVSDTIDCKSVQIGQYYHASDASVPIAKVDWHPWGEAGSTLLVVTIDGKLREYDISIDTEEPQQILSFMPEKKSTSYQAEDPSEREVVSFTLGKGVADWGPLTVYALTRSGDIYAICPYMPQNASIPSSYVHSLDCFISAKREYLSHNASSSKDLSMLYDYQHKYVSALLKQLPPGSIIPGLSRSVLMHPPAVVKSPPVRQGPFLLQPSPRTLDGSEGGDATDITYRTFGLSQDESDGEGEPIYLGAVLVAFQDGRVDVCLDVEKVEAKWEIKQLSSQGLPMLAVYENIDLGLVSLLKQTSDTGKELELLQGNHPLFYSDPIHDDTVYIYHAFGVHSLHLGPIFQSLISALRIEGEDEQSLRATLQDSALTTVQSILSTYSVGKKCSNPVIAVAIPNDVYLTYTIFILTSAMRITTFPLTLQDKFPRNQQESLTPEDELAALFFTPMDGPAVYVSLLGNEPYKPPDTLARPSGLPPSPRLSLPAFGTKELILTPETLRFIGTTIGKLSSQIHEIQLAYKTVEARATLQQQELKRQVEKCCDINQLVERMKEGCSERIAKRVETIQVGQKTLLGRLDRALQTLMERACPELNEHEMRWFDELKRMKEEVASSGRYDGESLVARTRLLEREFTRLMPNLKALTEKERCRKERLSESSGALGVSQAFELGERSNRERARISELEAELARLAAKLDLNLERPPSFGST
ncbi:hypothetical protein AX15_002498 [Amanita polypyramis BW_CC]|nr:hypothetical protein AX15_002498 [Amanita polypyramis BW_CC]